VQKLSTHISKDLQKKAKLLHRLTLSIRMQLSADLANHCWVANINDRTLTIITDDPSRASLIRFQQREILKQLNQELSLTVKEYLNRIKIRISNVVNGVEPPTKPLPLSRPSAQIINECANGIEDESLKKALQRLALRNKTS
jgi:hypothetical protein